MKWLIKKLTFDWRKVPRPERSGYLSVLLVYTAMCFYGEVNGNYTGNGFSIRCLWMPWECMKQEQVKEDKSDPQRARMVTPLVYCPKCRVREHPQRCFVHVDTKTGEAIKHLPPHFEMPLQSCTETSQKWYPVYQHTGDYPIFSSFVASRGSYSSSSKIDRAEWRVDSAELARFHVEIE